MSGVDLTHDAIRSVATALRSRLDDLPAPQRAWAALWRHDRARAWTAEAIEDYSRAAEHDPRCFRDLAIARHAHAWDLENAGHATEALEEWAAALSCWARVHADDEVWAALTAELRTVHGDRIDPEETVAAARRQLPAQLLALHVALAQHHGVQGGNAELGRGHMRAVETAGFPAETVAAARARLAEGWSRRVHLATEHRRFHGVFGPLDRLAELDPGNVDLLELLLDVVDRWVKHLNEQSGNWRVEAEQLLSRVEGHLEPIRDDEAIPPRLRSVLARFASWRGFQILQALTPDFELVDDRDLAAQENRLAESLGHLRRAQSLDPSLVAHPFYAVGRDSAEAVAGIVRVRRRRRRPGRDDDELLDWAADLAPDHEEIRALRGDRPNDDRGRVVDTVAEEVSADVVRRHVLDGDGPGAVAGLEALAARASSPAELRPVARMIPAARVLVASDTRLHERLDTLVLRLEGRPPPGPGLNDETVAGTDDEADDRATPHPWRSGGADPTNPASWRGPVTSPYRLSAFDLLDLPGTTWSRRDFQARVRRRVQRANAGQAQWDGRLLDETDVRTAEERLGRAPTWTAERLLVHDPHPVPLEVSDLRGRFAARQAPARAAKAPTLDRSALARLRRPREADGV